MGKYLEALKLLYGEDENNYETPKGSTDKTAKSPFVSNVSSTFGDIDDFSSSDELDSVPFTDHETAEHKINGLKLHGDRVFVRQKLIGIYGTNRLDIVNEYLEQWRLGAEAEPVAIKQENAGRYRANIWIREEKFN